MNRSPRSIRFALPAFGALLALPAYGAGYEKAMTWSAKSVSLGGAVVGSIRGAESLYFNPAGLALSTRRPQLSVNLSPTFSKFSGANPYHGSSTANNPPPVETDGDNGFSPVYGLLVSYKPTPKLGLGLGFYTSGGTKAKFADLDYQPADADWNLLHPTVETDIKITEIAAGGGYEFSPGLRVGLAWRIVSVGGSFSTVSRNGGNLLEGKIENLSAKEWTAFKLGAQYEEPAHRWGLGFAFRSSVDFTAKGDASARLQNTAGTVTSVGGSTAELDNTFPMQVSLGGWTRATELIRLNWQYDYTNYAKDEAVVIRGSVGGVSFSNIPQQWKNQHALRLGMEYTGTGLPIRLGYVYTTAVTSSEYARSTFSSPGVGHSLAAGTGMLITNGIALDGAVEYSMASGKGTNANSADGTNREVPTESSFSSRAIAVHLSGKYVF